MAINIKFTKFDNTSWGFRLAGGSDFPQPLTVIRVTEGGLAECMGLKVGDVVVRLNDQPVSSLTHGQAHEEVVRAGNNFVLAVQRGEDSLKAVEALAEENIVPYKIPLVELPPIFPEEILKEETVIERYEEETCIEERSGEEEVKPEVEPLPEKPRDANSEIVPNENLTDDEIAQLILEEEELLNEQGVLGVNFKKLKPRAPILRESKVLEELQHIATSDPPLVEELKRTSVFLQKPQRPVPSPRKKEEPEDKDVETYRVVIKKQQRRSITDRLLERGLLRPEENPKTPEPPVTPEVKMDSKESGTKIQQDVSIDSSKISGDCDSSLLDVSVDSLKVSESDSSLRSDSISSSKIVDDSFSQNDSIEPFKISRSEFLAEGLGGSNVAFEDRSSKNDSEEAFRASAECHSTLQDHSAEFLKASTDPDSSLKSDSFGVSQPVVERDSSLQANFGEATKGPTVDDFSLRNDSVDSSKTSDFSLECNLLIDSKSSINNDSSLQSTSADSLEVSTDDSVSLSNDEISNSTTTADNSHLQNSPVTSSNLQSDRESTLQADSTDRPETLVNSSTQLESQAINASMAPQIRSDLNVDRETNPTSPKRKENPPRRSPTKHRFRRFYTRAHYFRRCLLGRGSSAEAKKSPKSKTAATNRPHSNDIQQPTSLTSVEPRNRDSHRRDSLSTRIRGRYLETYLKGEDNWPRKFVRSFLDQSGDDASCRSYREVTFRRTHYAERLLTRCFEFIVLYLRTIILTLDGKPWMDSEEIKTRVSKRRFYLKGRYFQHILWQNVVRLLSYARNILLLGDSRGRGKQPGMIRMKGRYLEKCLKQQSFEILSILVDLLDSVDSRRGFSMIPDEKMISKRRLSVRTRYAERIIVRRFESLGTIGAYVRSQIISAIGKVSGEFCSKREASIVVDDKSEESFGNDDSSETYLSNLLRSSKDFVSAEIFHRGSRRLSRSSRGSISAGSAGSPGFSRRCSFDLGWLCLSSSKESTNRANCEEKVVQEVDREGRRLSFVPTILYEGLTNRIGVDFTRLVAYAFVPCTSIILLYMYK